MSSDLAKRGILLEVGTNEVEFLLFRLGTLHYGINVGKVCQITLFDESKVVPLPHSPKDLLGVMKFRERTISLIDLKSYLGVSSASTSAHRLLLVAEFNQRTIGFVIDAVERIERCTWKQFVPVTDTIAGASTNCVVGTVTLGETIIMILDLETIMSTIDPSMSIDAYADQITKNTDYARSKVSILHCEDSAVVQKTLLKTLETAGFRKFYTFPTGAEGLAFLNQPNAPKVDIILSDIEMPKMDGLTFCKNVRDNPLYKDLPFVFFSSMINEQMEQKCKGVGGDACFSKPQIHMIVDAIENLVKQS